MNRLKPVELKIKAGAFGLARPLLREGKPSLDGFDPAAVRKVLFLRPEKIGDMVVSLPTFDALRQAFPKIEIALLGSPRNLPLIRDDPRFDKVWVYRKNASDLGTLGAIRKEKYDVVIDMIHGDSVTSLFYSQLASPGAYRFGVGKTRHARYYDFNGMPGKAGRDHIIDVTLRLLEPFGIEIDEATLFAPPHLPEDAKRTRETFYRSIGAVESDLVIGFNLSAGKPNRIWPLDRASELSRRLAEEHDNLKLVVITAPDDRERGEGLVARTGNTVFHVPAGLNLLQVSAIISRLDLLITPDTSLVHIARSFKVPVVGLYNGAQKNLYLWQPYRQPEGVVVADHPDEIYDITPQQVMATVSSLLKSERSTA